MAIITLVTPISNIVGSFGGSTYQNSPGGLSLRSRPRQRKTGTKRQIDAVNPMSVLAVQWRDIGLSNQIQYDIYASLYERISVFGRSKKVSGWNWFTAMNWPNDFVGNSVAITPPAREVVNAITGLTIDVTATEINIRGTMQGTDGRYWVRLGMSSPSRYSDKRPTPNMFIIGWYNQSFNINVEVRAAYLLATGVDLCTLPAGGTWCVYVEALQFDRTSRLYSSPAHTTWPMAVSGSGIGYMAIGSSFIVA